MEHEHHGYENIIHIMENNIFSPLHAIELKKTEKKKLIKLKIKKKINSVRIYNLFVNFRFFSVAPS